MEYKKDLRLVNIYIRIHNKQVLTLDDLAYLAKYNPTCFKKTCDNLIYKVPEAKALVEPPKDAGGPAAGVAAGTALGKDWRTVAAGTGAAWRTASETAGAAEAGTAWRTASETGTALGKSQQIAAAAGNYPLGREAEEEIQSRVMIQRMFESLREMEDTETDTLQNIDITEVKELLGDLFMESLFPHSGLPEYFDICKEENGRLFNAKA